MAKSTTITIQKADGSLIELSYTDVVNVRVEDSGLKTEVNVPRHSEQIGYVCGNVDVLINTAELLNTNYIPDVLLSIGEADNDGFKWLTSASMYCTYNGRIMGRNRTLGYANTEKPLATKQWVRI